LAKTPFELAMEHVGGEAKMLEMVCERLGESVDECPPVYGVAECPSIPCGDCWMGYFGEKTAKEGSE
jgi:hypothetical protein